MTLTQLRYVITIADTGSMNEASKALFISQPSLSQAVKELETEIGVELFKRSNRGVSVTDVYKRQGLVNAYVRLCKITINNELL